MKKISFENEMNGSEQHESQSPYQQKEVIRYDFQFYPER